jgi:alkanesulfonate monooxygenase SsuD/methylene tetrahydromethanopterin reductase-like flavin-dependent oxidoreductase (luciferase family)
MRFSLHFDFRAPSWGVPPETIYAAALDQAAWADGRGFDWVSFPEHHGSEDGYVPSSMMTAAGVGARTRDLQLMLSVVLVPLHHPIRLAEDLAVLDLMSGGRVTVTLGLGYRQAEYEMFGVAYGDRVRLLEEGIRVLRCAFAGEPFEYQGRRVLVTPRPAREGGPPLLIGGSVVASARRAAALGDGFFPTFATPDLLEAYRDECAARGREPGPVLHSTGPMFLHVTRDPERAWDLVLPHVMHDMNMYGRWADEVPSKRSISPFRPTDDPAVVKGSPLYRVLTPEAAIELIRELEAGGSSHVVVAPMCGGLPPDVAWPALELFVEAVLPTFRA